MHLDYIYVNLISFIPTALGWADVAGGGTGGAANWSDSGMDRTERIRRFPRERRAPASGQTVPRPVSAEGPARRSAKGLSDAFDESPRLCAHFMIFCRQRSCSAAEAYAKMRAQRSRRCARSRRLLRFPGKPSSPPPGARRQPQGRMHCAFANSPAPGSSGQGSSTSRSVGRP